MSAQDPASAPFLLTHKLQAWTRHTFLVAKIWWPNHTIQCSAFWTQHTHPSFCATLLKLSNTQTSHSHINHLEDSCTESFPSLAAFLASLPASLALLLASSAAFLTACLASLAASLAPSFRSAAAFLADDWASWTVSL